MGPGAGLNDRDALFEMLVDELEAGSALMRDREYVSAALAFLNVSRHSHDLAKRCAAAHRGEESA